jgi:DNA-binding response OmpR family regulator/anti-sigma regulatory factor (Ser/Thr protein kinase)
MKLLALIVDDDPFFNEIAREFLALENVQSISVYSLKEAREYLLTGLPDFIILDSNLTDGIGIELLPDIKNAELTIPIMLITADEDQNTITRYFEHGIDDYICKPPNFDLMLMKIKRLLFTYNLQKKVVEQRQTLQRMLDEQKMEEQLARHVYEHMADSIRQENGLVKQLMRSSTLFNGDFLISCRSPDGNVFSLLLDATGHGLAAAISVLPLPSIFRTMVQKGLSLGSILYELNKKLDLEMPDDRFVAGILIEIDIKTNNIIVWNGGMPEVLFVDHSRNVIDTAASQHMPLGIIDSHNFDASTQTFKMQNICDVLMFSDGIIEQLDSDGKLFGMQGIRNSLSNCHSEIGLIQNIENNFIDFIGDVEQQDDVSVCQLNIADLLVTPDPSMAAAEFNSKQFGKGKVSCEMSISGEQLGLLDLVGCLRGMMDQTNMSTTLRHKAFTVLSELITNAFEHGVLGLKSDLKSEDHGFLTFFSEKESRIKNLQPSDNINFNFCYDNTKHEIAFSIQDSGQGFSPYFTETDDNSLSGRGMSLVKFLSEKVELQQPGNKTSVVIK